MVKSGGRSTVGGELHAHDPNEKEEDPAPPPPVLDRKSVITACLLLLFDSILTFAIIWRVPYTKIDWDAYMSQVTGFLAGERNYAKLRGDTGPLVYPAGFLYVYAAIRYLTGGAVLPAQIIFGFIYIFNLGIILSIYLRTNVLPWWGLCLLSLSKRVHSIFVLRLFNDCIATTIAHVAIALFQNNRWTLGLVVFSAAVSVKMNVLLYAPPLLLLMLKGMVFREVIVALSSAALVQILLGFSFLVRNPLEYILRAFNLGRVFIHFWSVNFKFLPEKLFVSKQFAFLLLTMHLGLLYFFARYKWCKYESSTFPAFSLQLLHEWSWKNCSQRSFRNILSSNKKDIHPRHLNGDYVTSVLFMGNFIGILCARSLHYQFYSWYFYSLPLLLWKTSFPTSFRLLLFCLIEICWNIYPSNSVSSILLFLCHISLLWGLWQAPAVHPYSAIQIEKLE